MTDLSITSICDKITKDGSSGFKAETGRYHLYISTGCPFAHRTTIVIALKGLQSVFTVDVVDPVNDGDKGWMFNPEKDGCTKDTLHGKQYLREIYAMSHPNYTGRITVPVLYDKKTNKIVNNESAQIIRMLYTEFNEFSSCEEKRELDLYPHHKQNEIDDVFNWASMGITRACYGAGFAQTQEEYNEQVNKLFTNLDKVEVILSKNRYITGDQLTEADVCLFVTLIRFDIAYYNQLKCNKKMICQYKNLWGYTRDIYQHGDVRQTVNFSHIKESYYKSKKFLVPTPVIPIGPALNFDEETDRKNGF